MPATASGSPTTVLIRLMRPIVLLRGSNGQRPSCGVGLEPGPEGASMVRHGVVGWDGSKAAVGALQWAARHYPEAQQLEVVEVQGDRRDRAPHGDPGETVDAIRAAHPDLDVHVTVEHGVVAGVLAARTAPDDLVVLGGRGNEESRLGHRTSTAYRVVLEADGPVAVVP